jgi:hypothetical protein
MVCTSKGLGSTSTPNVVAGWDSVKVTLVAPSVHNTLGVLLSVAGGEFHVAQEPGTVAACIGEENVTVCLPSVVDTEVKSVKSGTVMGSRLVELM